MAMGSKIAAAQKGMVGEAEASSEEKPLIERLIHLKAELEGELENVNLFIETLEDNPAVEGMLDTLQRLRRRY